MALLLATAHSQTLTISGPGVYTFTATHVIIDFKTVPQGGGEVTVSEFLTAPSPAPQGGTVAPYYLIIETDMPDNSFTALIQIENAASLGLGAAAIVEMENKYGDGWLLFSGTYAPGTPDFYRFQVNRFSLFAFLTPLAQPGNVYLATSNASPATNLEAYQSDIAGYYGPGDWGYTPGEQFFSIYAKTENLSEFYGCDLHLRWDPAVIELQAISEGNIWLSGSYNFFTFPPAPTDSLIVQAAAQTVPPANLTTGAADYLVKLDFKLPRPGFSIVEMVKYEFRDQLNTPVFFFTHPCKVKYFLGDFAYGFDETRGNGKVDFDDLVFFSLAYNSATSGWSGSQWLPAGTLYKRKYDIGPTDGAHFIFDNPLPDNKIDFEDLIIFSFSYGYFNEWIYPQSPVPSPAPAYQQLSKNVFKERFPLIGAGKPHPFAANRNRFAVSVPRIEDLKGFSFTIELLEEPAALEGIDRIELTPQNAPGLTWLLYNIEGNKLTVDGVALTPSSGGIACEGPLFYLNFRNTTPSSPKFRIASAILRDSRNRDIPVRFAGEGESATDQYFLTENYPNPFNGSTEFQVHLPRDGFIEIRVYNPLGQMVSTVFEGYLSRGIHSFSWNASITGEKYAPSGIYFLVLKAKDFSRVRKMYLIK